MTPTAPVDASELEAGMQRLRDDNQHWLTNGQAAAVLAELERLRAALTASGEDLAAEVRSREILKTHIHQMGDYMEHHESCPWRTHPFIQSCTCGLDALMKKGIAR